LLKLAAQGDSGASKDLSGTNDSETGTISLTNIKSNRLGHADKNKKGEELAALIASGKDTISINDAIRLPNAAQKPKGMVLSTDPNAPTQ
jgi:hypothetical protein